MTATFTTRRILSSVIAATLVALPSNGALAAPAAAAPTAKPPAAAPPASTPPATGTTTTPPATGTTTTPPASGTTTTPPADGTTPPPADGTTPPADGTTPPADGTDPNAPVDAVPNPEPPPEEPKVEPPPVVPVVPEGPERPPEPTIGNGKYKAKGTGLMIAGGTLFGVGLAGVLTTYFLTRCTEIEDNFACKNKQHNTFAVPATASLALLGAVLLLVGVGYHARYKKWERWTPGTAKKTALTPTMLRGGAGVSYTVKF